MPAPLLQLLDHLHRPKFAVADHRNPRSIGCKTPDVVQKRPLLISRAVALLRAHPAPSYGDGPPPISQTHHKQPMLETDLTPVDDQTDLAPLGGTFQQAARYGLVPNPDPYSGVIQQTAQTPGSGRKGGFRRGDLVCDLAQMNRAAQAKAHQKPAPVANAGYAFGRAQLYNQALQSTMELVDRHTGVFLPCS